MNTILWLSLLLPIHPAAQRPATRSVTPRVALPIYNLAGAVDFHAHSDPDSVPRSLDALELAELASKNGMRGLVLKNHWQPTSSLAYIVRRRVPGIEVFGGIALNRAVGGVNPEAVERMARTRGGYGRVVWLPTFDAAAIPLQPVASRSGSLRGGQERALRAGGGEDLLPEVRQVLAIVARENLVLHTGHYPPDTALAVIRAARAAGVRSIVVTHAMMVPIRMSIAQQKEAASLGAFIEHAYGGTLPSPMNPAQPIVLLDDYARAIREVGPEHCILTSDLGQAGNPVHTDGLRAFAAALLQRGFTVAEIDRMMKANPAKLLGLPN